MKFQELGFWPANQRFRQGLRLQMEAIFKLCSFPKKGDMGVAVNPKGAYIKAFSLFLDLSFVGLMYCTYIS